jgi:hypothetical protein
LCEKTLIDHHMISWDHLKAYELTEHMVDTMKEGLWKYSFHKGHIQSWDL